MEQRIEMGTDMKEKVKAFCRQKELLEQGDRVVVGLSGGADSVCLFLILYELAKEWNLTLFPVHINHGIRGEEADEDESFCENLCARLGVSLHRVFVPVEELAKEHGWTLEEAGRNARYREFLRRKEEMQCQKIAVAHHMDDQAETVLFQLFRGSRMKGLSGMKEKQGDIIRPLLGVRRTEIEAYLKEKNQDYCIDRTNLEEEYTRNKIRHRILPAAEEIQQKTVEHLADTAEYLSRVEDYMERLTDALYETIVFYDASPKPLWRISVSGLGQAEPLLAERVLYRVLCEAAGGKKDISSLYVAEGMELLDKQTGRKVQLPDGLWIKRSYDELWVGQLLWEEESFRKDIVSFPFEHMLPGGGHLRLELLENAEKNVSIPKSTYTKWFDYDKIKEIVSLRSPEEEDVLALYTDGRGKKVSDVLKDARVPKEFRRKQWVLAEGNRVLWIPGIRSSEAYRITEETKRIVIATINGGMEHGR